MIERAVVALLVMLMTPMLLVVVLIFLAIAFAFTVLILTLASAYHFVCNIGQIGTNLVRAASKKDH